MDRPYRISIYLRHRERPVTFDATRLPVTEEDVGYWITSEIVKLDEWPKMPDGLQWIAVDDVQAITFVRTNGAE